MKSYTSLVGSREQGTQTGTGKMGARHILAVGCLQPMVFAILGFSKTSMNNGKNCRGPTTVYGQLCKNKIWLSVC